MLTLASKGDRTFSMPEFNDENKAQQNIFSDALGGRKRDASKAYSRAVRRKLYFLFAMLVAVLIMMKEASKPERWAWMGFESATSATTKLNGTAIELRSPAIANPIANDSFADAEPLTETGEPQSASIDFETEPASLGPEFWNQTWEKLNTTQKTGLLKLIQRVRDSNLKPPRDSATLLDTVEVLQTRRLRFTDEKRQQIDFSNQTDAVKKIRTAELDAFESLWNTKLQPALAGSAAGKDCTVAQQQQVTRLLKTLDRLIFADLEDFSSPGRIGDLPAWHRFWDLATKNETLPNVETLPNAETVAPVQLRTQPEIWRGKPVRIEGQLLAGKKIDVGPQSPLAETGHYYEWWIGNQRGGSEVFCVYSIGKPAALNVTDQFEKFDTPMQTVGYFYKIRSYIDDRANPNHCPLIIANTIDVENIGSSITASSWQPNFASFLPWLIGIAVAVFGIAMWLHRADRKKPYAPGGEHLKTINAHLRELSDDPAIKSVAEQLEELP